MKAAWEQRTLYGSITISEIKLFWCTSIELGRRAWQVTVGKLFQAGPFGELNLMPMVPQFKKNCKLPDFFFFRCYFVKRHSRAAWCNKNTLLFHLTVCTKPALHYLALTFLLCFCVHWWQWYADRMQNQHIRLWTTIRLMWGKACMSCVFVLSVYLLKSFAFALYVWFTSAAAVRCVGYWKWREYIYIYILFRLQEYSNLVKHTWLFLGA